jgi:preprotein translocase subunit SecF
MKLSIIQNRTKFFTFSGFLVVVSLLSLIAWGLKPGIDFTGGSLMELQFNTRPTVEELQTSLKDFGLGEITVQSSGADDYLVRFKDVDEETHQKIVDKLKVDFKSSADTQENVETQNLVSEKPAIEVVDDSGKKVDNVSFSATTNDGKQINNKDTSIKADVSELRFESIGPSIGQELKQKALWALIYAVIAIILFVAWAFRHVSKPVQSWKYGIVAVVAIGHDVLITIGVFVFLGHFFGVEINTPFIAAILTVFGYSVNDTIIVFDRIRENLRRYHEDFEKTVNDSVNETFVRSINTSATALFVLIAIYFFGGETVKNFVLTLIVGIAFGTYSSIFIASPLLVTWHKLTERLSKNG